jgi:hypothetical protein
MKIQIVKVTDDDGIIALVNPASYHSSLRYQDSWTWGELKDFLSKENCGNLILWESGMEAEWTVHVADTSSAKSCFREYEQYIKVTDGTLALVSFSALTLPLSEKDKKFTPEYDEQLLTMENGIYSITIRQLFNPEDDDYDPDGKVNFELLIKRQNSMPSEPESPATFIVWANPAYAPKDDDIFISHERDEFDDLLDRMLAGHNVQMVKR